MEKIKKLLSLFTAVVVAASIALSSGVASALNADQIKGEIRDLTIHYQNQNRQIQQHDGWLNLFSKVLEYAEATNEDVHAVNPHNTQHWADYIARPNGFIADENNEAANLRAMLTNFGNNDGYFESGWRVKNDFKLLPDCGAIYLTVQHRDGREKPYVNFIYNESKFLTKIREIYNLNPVTNAQKYDALCLRAVLRAIVEYDKYLGCKHDENLNSFFDGIMITGLKEELLLLFMNQSNISRIFGTNDNFSLADRAVRQNAVDGYKKLSRLLISAYYEVSENLVAGQEKIEGRDFNIVFDNNGYVLKIEPIKNGNGAPAPPKEYTIKKTGSGVDHFAAALVALAVSVSGIAGLGYVISRKKRKNAV